MSKGGCRCLVSIFSGCVVAQSETDRLLELGILRVPLTSHNPQESIRKTIFAACLDLVPSYNAAETLVLIPLLRLLRRRA